MALTIQADPIPLRVDEHGVIRVGDSQVLLDIVIREFNNGAEPHAIAQGYPTLQLADNSTGLSLITCGIVKRLTITSRAAEKRPKSCGRRLRPSNPIGRNCAPNC